MGIKLFSSSSYDCCQTRPVILGPPNPNPSNFTILTGEGIGDFAIIKVKYAGCTTFEGTKILVYKACLNDVLKQATLDPHFSESKEFLSPIARFIPTAEGMIMARQLCEFMSGNTAI